jgi:hypothetical protein
MIEAHAMYMHVRYMVREYFVSHLYLYTTLTNRSYPKNVQFYALVILLPTLRHDETLELIGTQDPRIESACMHVLTAYNQS